MTTTMHPVKARVKNGRLVLDVPTDLPEGQEVELVRLDEALDWTDADHAEASRGWADEIARRAARVRAGESSSRPADEVLARVEAKLRGG